MPKLSGSDAFLAAAAAVGLIVVVGLYGSAFPTSIVTLEATREVAIERATTFLEQQGADLTDYRRAAVFSGDTESLVFLQRTLGNDEAGRWAREEVPIWSWDIRWFRPRQVEEWLGYVGVDGEIIGFRHVLEETAEGADLDEAAARAIAERFLVERGHALDELDPVQASADRKDNRTDHLFVWENRDARIEWTDPTGEAGTGGARILVGVLGNRVGAYSRYMQVPQGFSREFEGTLSRGTFLAIGSIAISVLLAIVAMVLAIMRYRSGEVNWRVAIIAGGIVGVMMTIYTVTAWPLAMFQYQTQIDWSVFVGTLAVGVVLAAAFYVVWVLFPTAAGESLARDYYPESLRGFADAMGGRIFTREFGVASLRGYGLAAALLGYLTAFYWFAQRYLGAWLPAEGPYSEIFNNTMPFLAPLTVSLVAAISEETIYRLFGISLFKKLTGSTAIALVIPAAIWAFGHSNYPVFPVYIRGIELTIGGVLFGLAFLRYGLVACIVAHYVIDAVALGFPLLTSGNTTYLVFGVTIMALALVPGAAGLVAGRRGPGDTTAGTAAPPPQETTE